MTVTQEDKGMAMLAVSDKTVEALAAAMFVHGSSRERYRQLSMQAAQLERNGQYDSAMHAWTLAASQALYDVERHWCESRAHWCEHCLPCRGRRERVAEERR